jgi:hypothetical protein
MRRGGFTLFLCAALASALPVQAETRLSLGYGMQLNSMLNSTLNDNLQKQVLNSGAAPIVGQSAGTDYRSNWKGETGETLSAYHLISLPELRISSDFSAGQAKVAFFGALSGIVPQTSAYYAGSYQLSEATTCSGVQYATCPLAAVNFVSASGKATYDSEIRTNLRFYAITVGMSYTKILGPAIGGEFALAGELGIMTQVYAARTEFSVNRCTTGGSVPCAQIADVRAVQGELTTESVYAFGPVLGATLRYQRPDTSVYFELGASAVFLFMRLQNSGYTNFVGGSSVAFTQSSQVLGVQSEQDTFSILPSVTVRCGIKL